MKRIEIKRPFEPFSNKLALALALVMGVLLTALHFVGFIELRGPQQMQDAHILLNLVLNLLFSYILFALNFSIAKADFKAPKRYVIAIGSTLLVIGGYTLLTKGLRLWIYDEVIISRTVNLNLLKYVVMALTVLLITFLLFVLEQRQKIELENRRLAEENIRIRYDALETKLAPHFLFNSLNTLSGLIGISDQRSLQYVQQLAQTYRYIIQDRKLVTLRDELLFTDSYVYLMQIRYGENLTVVRHIPEEVMDLQCLPISVQLLVENAIKHNVISEKHPLRIEIGVADNWLTVSNAICLKTGVIEGAGIGLSSLIERYRLLCHQDIVINRTDTEFKVSLPLVASAASD